MRLRWGFICDYASYTHESKLIAVGIVERFTSLPGAGAGMRVLGAHVLCVSLAASNNELGSHERTLRLVDDDGQVILTVPVPPFVVPAVPNHPELESVVTWAHQNGPTAVPSVGGYVWEILVDKVRIGEIPFQVLDAPAPQQPPVDPSEVWKGPTSG